MPCSQSIFECLAAKTKFLHDGDGTLLGGGTAFHRAVAPYKLDLYKLVQGLVQALCELVQVYGALVQGPCMSSYETRTYYVLP